MGDFYKKIVAVQQKNLELTLKYIYNVLMFKFIYVKQNLLSHVYS
jgi:hypothetical protein